MLSPFQHISQPKFLSKKIKKFSKFIRRPFKEDTISTCDLRSNLSEDLDPETINYINPITGKTFYFSCFPEKDLKIPEELKKNTVELVCDDDCKTDDEQIESAIRKLYKAISLSASARKKMEERE